MKPLHTAAIAFVVLVLSAIVTTFPAQAQVSAGFSAADIVGLYDVTGRNPDGSAYGGLMDLSVSNGGLKLDWRVEGRSYQGEGRIVGNVLVVDWGAQHPIVYTLSNEGVLAATWDDGRASERATPR